MTGMLSSAGANASEGAGGAVQAAHSVTGSELTIVQAGAAGDEIYHLWAFPWDFDRSEPIRWRPIFSACKPSRTRFRQDSGPRDPTNSNIRISPPYRHPVQQELLEYLLLTQNHPEDTR